MTPPPQPDDAHPFAPFLQPGEELLWVGQPNAEAYVINQKQKTVLAFWCGTVLLFVFSAFAWTGNHRLAILATVVSFATWWIVFAVPLIERKQNKNWQRIKYAISEKRVMAYVVETEEPFRALPFNHVSRLIVKQPAHGVNTLVCRPPDIMPAQEVVFENIENVRVVCEQIRTAAGRNIPIVEKR